MTGAEAMIPGLVQIQTSILTELAVIGTNTSSLGHISGLFISPGESVGRYGSVAASCFVLILGSMKVFWNGFFLSRGQSRKPKQQRQLSGGEVIDKIIEWSQHNYYHAQLWKWRGTGCFDSSRRGRATETAFQPQKQG